MAATSEMEALREENEELKAENARLKATRAAFYKMYLESEGGETNVNSIYTRSLARVCHQARLSAICQSLTGA